MQRSAGSNPVVDLPSKPAAVKATPGAKRLKAAVSSALAAFGAQLASAVLWFLLLTAGGALLLVAGIFVLVGLGWSLIAGGGLCILAASFIRKGIAGG